MNSNNKRMTVRPLIIGSVILSIILFTILNGAINYVLDCLMYPMYPEGCERILGLSPQEFFETEFDIYDEIGDFRRFSYIDEEGMQLVLTPRQKKQFLKVYKEKFFEYCSSYENVEISNDCKTVVINGFAETVDDDLSTIFGDGTKSRLFFIQWLSGIPVSRTKIKLVLQDGLTGEVFAVFDWPKEAGLSIALSDYNFSSINDKTE